MSASLTRYDSRVEAATSLSIAALHAAQDAIGDTAVRLRDAHQRLALAETRTAFELLRLRMVCDRQRRVDDQLLDDIATQLEVLEDITTARDEAEQDLLDLLAEAERQRSTAAVAVAAAPAVVRSR
ncbi:hypothetical protein [Kitasatospora phosalacinea]|uniref:Uncharacterized protein n=1 Tax=Kitasatospora phosalacinea TaxID=2065 RepID=A0A9W6URC8_9ACTN|nr:hypothetical protein [Kitasatospora phosalacinea]GLW58169.1 hypothetical protein Kpho01_61800 [Kitasatospora phosalacinea]